MKVYVISQGSYSSTNQIAVVTEAKIERAREIKKLLPEISIQEFELDDLGFESIVNPGMGYFSVEITKDAKVKECWEGSTLDWNGTKRKEQTTLRIRGERTWRLKFQGYAKSEEHARRHVEELRRQILAGQHPESVELI